MDKIIKEYLNNEIKNYEDKSRSKGRLPELSKYKEKIVKKFLKDLKG